jgi:hypothetical protein
VNPKYQRIKGHFDFHSRAGWKDGDVPADVRQEGVSVINDSAQIEGVVVDLAGEVPVNGAIR